MSDTIISRIDDMGGRIEELEKSINDLMVNASTTGATGAAEGAPAAEGK